MMHKFSRSQIAWRLAQDIKDGDYVNLGIGIPTLISKCLPADRDVILHSENGAQGVQMPRGSTRLTHVNMH